MYMMWDAKQGGGFNYPYVEYPSFNVSTGPATSISASSIWNTSYTWAYPGMGVNGRGSLGVSIRIGGGTWGYPGSQFLIDDDISGGWAAYFLDSGSHANTRWGDFLTARAATTGTAIGDTWIATGFTLHDSSGSAETYPSFYWLGRNRDDPFTPTGTTTTPTVTPKGRRPTSIPASSTGRATVRAITRLQLLGRRLFQRGDPVQLPGGLLRLAGPHTYAEEGSYTTSLYGYDNWGGAASGNGSATVSDAPLSGTPRTIYAAAGTPTAGKVVALFKDADPGGTVSDYTASINWGDGNTSAGTVGVATIGGFNVKGTHTYGSTGTFTITVTISDVGGATRTVTSHTNVGPRPVVTKISPIKGTHLGGTTVTITRVRVLRGHRRQVWHHPRNVVGGGKRTKITVKSPAHTAGQVDVTVTTKYRDEQGRGSRQVHLHVEQPKAPDGTAAGPGSGARTPGPDPRRPRVRSASRRPTPDAGSRCAVRRAALSTREAL